MLTSQVAKTYFVQLYKRLLNIQLLIKTAGGSTIKLCHRGQSSIRKSVTHRGPWGPHKSPETAKDTPYQATFLLLWLYEVIFLKQRHKFILISTLYHKCISLKASNNLSYIWGPQGHFKCPSLKQPKSHNFFFPESGSCFVAKISQSLTVAKCEVY